MIFCPLKNRGKGDQGKEKGKKGEVGRNKVKSRQRMEIICLMLVLAHTEKYAKPVCRTKNIIFFPLKHISYHLLHHSKVEN